LKCQIKGKIKNALICQPESSFDQWEIQQSRDKGDKGDKIK
jgi:hypothetical protein